MIKLAHIVICIMAIAAEIILAKTALYMKFLGFKYFAHFVVSDDIAGAIMVVAIAITSIYLICSVYYDFFVTDGRTSRNNDSCNNKKH